MNQANIVELNGRESEPQVIALLASAQIHRSAADALSRAPSIAVDYANSPSLCLLGLEQDGGVVGLIGIERTGAGTAIIRDLAVDPNQRRLGIARRLIEHLRKDLGLTNLYGDTLEAAVPFYERCGFSVTRRGALADGSVVYRFEWSKD